MAAIIRPRSPNDARVANRRAAAPVVVRTWAVASSRDIVVKDKPVMEGNAGSAGLKLALALDMR